MGIFSFIIALTSSCANPADLVVAVELMDRLIPFWRKAQRSFSSSGSL